MDVLSDKRGIVRNNGKHMHRVAFHSVYLF
jgi:hypothetical protein